MFIGGMAIYFLFFFSQRKTVPLFLCCNSVIGQTKEAQMKSIICSSWVSFLFLSQSSSVEAAQAQATFSSSVFCHGKKIETQEQENMVLLWSQAKLAFFEPYKYLFICKSFYRRGPALKITEIYFLQPALLPVSKFLLLQKVVWDTACLYISFWQF